MPTSTEIQPANLIVLHVLLGFIIFVVLVMVGTAYVAAQDNRRRRERLRQYKIEQERAADEFRILVANRTAEILARQKAEQPAITVPVTNCDRRARRKFLPLEPNDATR